MESSEVSVHADLKKAVGSRDTRIFWEMFENQKQGWLSGYFRRHDVVIEPEGIDLLLDLVENNTFDLRQEADRLIAFVGKRITADDVDQYIYHAREESVFTLYDAVIAQDLDRALDIVAKLTVTVDAVQIVLGLAWQLDRLYEFQVIRSDGFESAEAFEELHRRTGRRVTGKRLQKSLLEAASRYSLPECTAIRIVTGDTDALLRTVPAPLHEGIVQQYIYSVIVRRGNWSVSGTFKTRRPWEYP
jgi:DNA polymerase III subunit delta